MKYGFLFGAGAEVGYGLPSGGMFALDIFRQDMTKSKSDFKEMRDNVDKTCTYANEWLPHDFPTKNISSFGKTVYQNIIKDTVEHNRSQIIRKLNRFDDIATEEDRRLKREAGISAGDAMEQKLGRAVSNIRMGQSVSYIEEFESGNGLFNNSYFAAFLLIYKRKCLDAGRMAELRKILLSIMQLQVGALGEDLSRKINDNLFASKDEDIDFLDDIGEILQINYSDSGTVGMEYLLEYRKADTSTDDGVILRLAQMILESIYSSVLDYKSLIDSYWHYLYNPRHEWAKFCKICIFLLTVKNYISEKAKASESLENPNGYYDMLKASLDNDEFEASVIATTNYNNLIGTRLARNITYLNGSVELWYDPYVNRIGSMQELYADGENHFIVPLLFTQSGTKPMTSITMSELYVDAYRSWKESDALVVVGFGFGADDEHINGIVRTLADIDGKAIKVITLDHHRGEEAEKKAIIERLKLRNADRLSVILVDKDGKECASGKQWTEVILE